MADAELSAKISTTSDIPQAMDKAKAATASLAGQVNAIGTKFSTAFKDIALAFVAPVVLLNTAISLLSDYVAKVKKDAQDGLDLLAKGETIYANAEEKKMANFFKAKKAREDEIKMSDEGKAAMTRAYLETPEGKEMSDKIIKQRMKDKTGGEFGLVPLARDKEIQDLALKAFLASPEGKAYQPIFNDKKDQNFKGPEGFSNVIGVGANPVMEAMAEQTELARQQLAELQKLNAKGNDTQTDFTKDSK